MLPLSGDRCKTQALRPIRMQAPSFRAVCRPKSSTSVAVSSSRRRWSNQRLHRSPHWPVDGCPAAGRSLARLDEATLHAAVATALETFEPQRVVFEDANVVCHPIAGPNDRASGAVLLVGHDADSSDGFGDRAHLTTVASWVSNASAAHTSSAAQDAVEVHRLAALLRILEKAVARGSEREVVSALIEAFAVWTDREAWGYLGDLTDQFQLQVLLPGSDRASAPAILSADIIPLDRTFGSLSAAEAALADFGGATPISILRIRPKGASDWLIAVRGTPDSREQARLVLYGDVLAQALTTLTAIASSRLTWAMFQHLWPVVHEGSLERAAESAIAELTAVVGGCGCFSVIRDGGAQPVLSIGRAAHLVFSATSAPTSEFLGVSIPVSAPYKAGIGIGPPVDGPLTRRDETLVHCSRQVLGVWLNAVIARLATPDRERPRFRSFDQIVERHAHEAHEAQGEISMIVVSIASAAPWIGPVQAWVADIQRQLRPRDVTGRLASGDIGILLPDTSEEGAQVVASRLRRLIESDRGFGALSGAYLGLAVRPVGSQSTESLMAETEMRAAAAFRLPAYQRMEDQVRVKPGSAGNL